jgi:exopolysaccharide production protein ExoZ
MSVKTYKSLQVCRVVAGMLVVLYHLGGAFGADKYFGTRLLESVMSLGHHAVVFFFVLSGFIIVRLHYEEFGKPQYLGAYCWKRAIRVFPAYLIVLLVVYATASAIPALRDSMPHDPWVLIKTALLLPQDRLAVGGTGAPILIVAWSMQYEMIFYALIGLFIFSRWLGSLAVIALLVNFFSCKLTNTCEFPRSFFASSFILPFMFGAIAAMIIRHPYRMHEPLRIVMAAISAIALLRGLDVLFHIDYLFVDTASTYGVLSMILIVALVHAEEAGLIPVHRYWQHLAGAGYALYLLHFPIISVFCKLSVSLGVKGEFSIGAAFVAIFVACVLISLAFHKFVERPLISNLLMVGQRARQVSGLRVPS